MFRLWARLFTDNRMEKDIVIENNDTSMNRTAKVFDALEKACYEFDLSHPVWLDINIADFKRISKTRFRADNFIDAFPYDYLEIQIIEEDI